MLCALVAVEVCSSRSVIVLGAFKHHFKLATAGVFSPALPFLCRCLFAQKSMVIIFQGDEKLGVGSVRQ